MTYLHGTVFTRQYLLSTSHITQYIHLLTLQSQQTKKKRFFVNFSTPGSLKTKAQVRFKIIFFIFMIGEDFFVILPPQTAIPY